MENRKFLKDADGNIHCVISECQFGVDGDLLCVTLSTYSMKPRKVIFSECTKSNHNEFLERLNYCFGVNIDYDPNTDRFTFMKKQIKPRTLLRCFQAINFAFGNI